ncbi:MAG: hypothetical protein L0170_10425, partial [Acidobacteria bacterium]|nr:hypothetical protein [Acidobacteriota bacterium]
MKNTVKYLAVVVVALTVSSALFAAPGGNSANCSTTPTTDAATWGIAGHSVRRLPTQRVDRLRCRCPRSLWLLCRNYPSRRQRR